MFSTIHPLHSGTALTGRENPFLCDSSRSNPHAGLPWEVLWPASAGDGVKPSPLPQEDETNAKKRRESAGSQTPSCYGPITPDTSRAVLSAGDLWNPTCFATSQPRRALLGDNVPIQPGDLGGRGREPLYRTLLRLFFASGVLRITPETFVSCERSYLRQDLVDRCPPAAYAATT